MHSIKVRKSYLKITFLVHQVLTVLLETVAIIIDAGKEILLVNVVKILASKISLLVTFARLIMNVKAYVVME